MYAVAAKQEDGAFTVTIRKAKRVRGVDHVIRDVQARDVSAACDSLVRNAYPHMVKERRVPAPSS